MKVAVVNIFDPLGGEPMEEARYAGFCRALVGDGHDVVWYNSDFSHILKCPRDESAITAAAKEIGYKVVLAPSRPYGRNVVFGRLISHRLTARALGRIWAAETYRPDVILVSTPPPSVARQAAMWASSVGAKLVVDVQDFWPETMRRFWPMGLGWLNPLIFRPMIRAQRAALRQADGVVGVSREYLEYASNWARPETPMTPIHLGMDIEQFDAAVRPLDALGLDKRPGEKWLFLSGTLGNYLEIDGLLEMMELLKSRGRDDIKLVAVGSGPREQYLRDRSAARQLDSVVCMGRQPYEVFASVAAASSIGMVPIRPGSLVFFPYRLFQCFAAGLPVLSTIGGGELEEFLAEHDAGATCDPRQPAAWADTVERLLGEKLDTDHARRRGDWVRQFDRKEVSLQLVRFLSEVAAKR